MTRKEIKKRICELHEQLQKTDFATTIINRQELETRIQEMDYRLLVFAMRFLEALLYPDQE